MNPGKSRVETSTEFRRRMTHIRIMSTQPMSSVVELDHFKLHRKSFRIASFGSSHLISPSEHFSFKSYTRTPIALVHATNCSVHAMAVTKFSASQSTVAFKPLRNDRSCSVSLWSPIMNRRSASDLYCVGSRAIVFTARPMVNFWLFASV